jgi:hypothetical protein
LCRLGSCFRALYDLTITETEFSSGIYENILREDGSREPPIQAGIQSASWPTIVCSQLTKLTVQYFTGILNQVWKYLATIRG